MRITRRRLVFDSYIRVSRCRSAVYGLVATLLAACASTPPSPDADNPDYGPYPDNYREIVRTYLEANPTLPSAIDPARIRFLNTPDKYIARSFGRQDVHGYRVCTMVTTTDGRDTTANFFLVYNGRVVKHLYDAGLVKLSGKFCNIQRLTSGTKDTGSVEPTVTGNAVDRRGLKYIVCTANNAEIFFAFSEEKQQLLEQRYDEPVASYTIEKLSETVIIATGINNTRISINRISGSMLYQQPGTESAGRCELTSKQIF